MHKTWNSKPLNLLAGWGPPFSNRWWIRWNLSFSASRKYTISTEPRFSPRALFIFLSLTDQVVFVHRSRLSARDCYFPIFEKLRRHSPSSKGFQQRVNAWKRWGREPGALPTHGKILRQRELCRAWEPQNVRGPFIEVDGAPHFSAWSSITFYWGHGNVCIEPWLLTQSLVT